MGKTKSIWAEIEEKLKKELTENRYRHTMGVTYTACALAMVHGADLNQARMGGLLHDCAKCIPNSEKIEICKKKKIEVSEFEIEHPVLLHAKLGAYLAKKEYGCDDQAILDAITWHTTGRPAMTLLEKIVFVSDYIEPNREKQPNLAEIRKLAFSDIDQCMYQILRDTVDYLSENPKSMDHTTLSAYSYYKKLIRGRETAI
uniref:bis(5'-nucleosyl)-tetraphosphatase (symmetrical) YqeK n=1 Tax=Eubacterium cellulosolvens TaxID=29322 RepID=UPI000487BFCA|nr:bis(5'-nucleosyl)-tetraphosphatase (symmetrical) YqeK [[Eubacterium] cellulosolvens]